MSAIHAFHSSIPRIRCSSMQKKHVQTLSQHAVHSSAEQKGALQADFLGGSGGQRPAQETTTAGVFVSRPTCVKAIAEANEQIDVLKADIQKYTADAAQLTKEIAGLDWGLLPLPKS
jgi:hypothetical protein